MLLIAKYQLELKKKGTDIKDQNCSITLGMFKKILEELNRMTQEEKNDQFVLETEVVKPIFMNLEGLVTVLECDASLNEKRPALMRKNSLKKI